MLIKVAMNGVSSMEWGIFILISLTISLLKAWRFFLLLRINKINIAFLNAYTVFITGQLTSPFPGGEITRGILLKKKFGVRLRDTASSIMTLTFVDYMAASLLFIVGGFLFELFAWPIVINLLILSMLILIIVRSSFFHNLLKILSYNKYLAQYSTHLTHIRNEIKHMFFYHGTLYLRMSLLKVLVLAIVSQLLGGMLLYTIGRSLEVPLTYWEGSFMYSSAIILQTLSFIPAGLGVTDGGLTGLLVLFHGDLSKAISLVLIFRIVTVLFNMGVGLVFFMIFYGKSFFQLKPLR